MRSRCSSSILASTSKLRCASTKWKMARPGSLRTSRNTSDMRVNNPWEPCRRILAMPGSVFTSTRTTSATWPLSSAPATSGRLGQRCNTGSPPGAWRSTPHWKAGKSSRSFRPSGWRNRNRAARTWWSMHFWIHPARPVPMPLR